MNLVSRAVFAAALSLASESTLAQEQSPITRLTLERSAERPASQATDPSADRTKDFIRAVLGDTEDVWDGLFPAVGDRPYPKPKVVLVSRRAVSNCGALDVSSAPIYCAIDSKVYLDPAFLRDLSNRSGDFAAAYAIAREIGHHVQNMMGSQQSQDPKMQARLEMQADCYVGVWAHSVQKRALLDPGEIESGAAAAVMVVGPRDYSERLRRFKEGLATGDPRSCRIAAPSKASR